MKHNYFIAILLMVFLVSCSSDDNGTTPDNDNTEADFLPLKNGAFWTYDVSGDIPGRDSLYVANDTTINSTSYKKLKTKDFAYGFFSGSLAENGVRKSGSKLLVSGSTGINLLEGFPIDLDVNDFVIFKENATSSEQLDMISGVIDYEYENIPLVFTYNMKSIFQESLASYNVPNYGTYQDVKVIKVIVNLKVGGVYSGLPFTLMNEQNVLVSTQYYAKNIGMVYSNTTIEYQLNNHPLLANIITIPTASSQNIKEYLADYNTGAPAN